MTSFNVDPTLAPSLPGGPGLTERNIQAASGLRTFVQTGIFTNDDRCVASAPIVNASSWTVLPIIDLWGTSSSTASPQTYSPYRNRLPFPCTPCVTYRQMNATPNNGQTFSIWVEGFDQFDQPIKEIIENQVTLDSTHTTGTPPAPYTRKTRLWLSKVFAEITRVLYKASSVQGTDDFIDIGVAWDFDNSGNAEPYTNYIGQSNQGVGTPFRMNPYGPSNPVRAPECLGIQLINLDPQVLLLQGGTNANPAVYTVSTSTPLVPLAITNFSIANPTVVTCAAHGMPAGSMFPVVITGDAISGKTYLNGLWLATYASGTTFTIPANVTSTHSSYTNIACWIPGLNEVIDRRTPVIVGGLASPNPATLNGFQRAIVLTSGTFSVPINATAAGTGGYVQILRQPSASVQAYDGTYGGFRVGTNASGYVGTANKWNIYKGIASSGAIPQWLLSGNEGYVQGDLSVEPAPFPWPRDARVQFNAYFRTGLNTRPSNSSSSYAT